MGWSCWQCLECKRGNCALFNAGKTWEVPFIKFSSFRDASLASSGIVKQLAFVTSGIFYENAFFSMWLKRVALISLNMDIGCASPNSEVGNIWFAFVEGLKWGGVRKGSCRKAIPDMNHRGKTVAPK